MAEEGGGGFVVDRGQGAKLWQKCIEEGGRKRSDRCGDLRARG